MLRLEPLNKYGEVAKGGYAHHIAPLLHRAGHLHADGQRNVAVAGHHGVGADDLVPGAPAVDLHGKLERVDENVRAGGYGYADHGKSGYGRDGRPAPPLTPVILG